MKWFTKWFQKKCVKEFNEQPNDGIMTSLDHIRYGDIPKHAPEEMFAFSTAKNFHYDYLTEFAVDSEWVFLNREQLVRPNFQNNFSHCENLTNLCKRLSERARIRKVVMVIGQSPSCHCNLLSSDSEPIYHEVSAMRRILEAIAEFWCRVCRKLKNCKLCGTKKDQLKPETVCRGFHFVLYLTTRAYLALSTKYT